MSWFRRNADQSANAFRAKTAANALQSAQLPSLMQRAMNTPTGLMANHNAMLQQMAMMGMGTGKSLFGEPQHPADPNVPNTLGWRSWNWDIEAGRLFSPTQGTQWDTSELRCDSWDESGVIRGTAGIHAMLVPMDWAKLDGYGDHHAGHARLEADYSGRLVPRITVSGIVERFGKYVLGTEGWRAEWVVIKQLCAPTTKIGLAMERAYPDVEVVYGDR